MLYGRVKKKKKPRAVSGPNINTATSTRLASVERAGQVPYGLGGTRVSRTTALRSLPHLVPSRPTCRNFMEKTKSVSIRPPWLLKQPPRPASRTSLPSRPSSCCNAPRPPKGFTPSRRSLSTRHSLLSSEMAPCCQLHSTQTPRPSILRLCEGF